MFHSDDDDVDEEAHDEDDADEEHHQVPEEESKVANQHRSSVDMTSHPQVVSFLRIFICNGYDYASAFQTPDFDEVRNSPSRNSVR